MADLTIKHPIPYEPQYVNRWLLRLPKFFNVPEWLIQSVTPPRCSRKDGKLVWDDILVEIRVPIGIGDNPIRERVDNGIKELMLDFGRINFGIVVLDPVGMEIEIIDIFGVFDWVEYGEFDYGEMDNPIQTIKMNFKVNNIDFRWSIADNKEEIKNEK